ncbi:PadR family transcriptional regulator [Actinomadura rubteroloni]|uniref:PadR family transcriptional regulator n=1 Tax=Actinomadura rubteroloni TaxID=1926885 RepID=UPI000CD8DBB1|nr:PadR family transcriptional regulator [Actinomadura rubteroloni]
MSGVQRVTGPLLDVLEALVEVYRQDGEVHGWDLMKTTRRAGPTVYRVLDRLEDAGWVAARWEDAAPDPSRPRRRFYRLNPDGLAAARTLLAERRPAALDRTSRPPRPASGTTFRRLFRPRPTGGTT